MSVTSYPIDKAIQFICLKHPSFKTRLAYKSISFKETYYLWQLSISIYKLASRCLPSLSRYRAVVSLCNNQATHMINHSTSSILIIPEKRKRTIALFRKVLCMCMAGTRLHARKPILLFFSNTPHLTKSSLYNLTWVTEQ